MNEISTFRKSMKFNIESYWFFLFRLSLHFHLFILLLYVFICLILKIIVNAFWICNWISLIIQFIAGWCVFIGFHENNAREIEMGVEWGYLYDICWHSWNYSLYMGCLKCHSCLPFNIIKFYVTCSSLTFRFITFAYAAMNSVGLLFDIFHEFYGRFVCHFLNFMFSFSRIIVIGHKLWTWKLRGKFFCVQTGQLSLQNLKL